MSSPIDSKGSCLLLICLPAVSRLLTLTYVAEDSDDLRLESELPERLREGNYSHHRCLLEMTFAP